MKDTFSGSIQGVFDMKISCAEMRRLLPVGTTFQAEFIGDNRRFARPNRINTSRRVTTQTAHQMESLLFPSDGSDPQGIVIYLTWKGLEIENSGKEYLFTNKEDGELFLKITLS
jgi:hypothetical protein